MYQLQIKTFVIVAEAGSFNKAAKELFITPTAVIKQINLLEEKLGLQLFEREHTGLTLTASGQSLYQDAKYMIQYSRESLIRAKNAGRKEDVIRIGSSPMTPPQVLMDLWPKIHEVAPHIKLEMVPFENTPENAREILKNLGQNIDLVTGIFDDVLISMRGCKGLKLTDKLFACAVPINHPLADKDQLELSDLLGERLLIIRRDWSHYVDRLRDDLTLNHPEIHLETFDFYDLDVFNRAVNTNTPLLVVDMWRDVHPLLKIIPVNWSHHMPFGLVYALEPSEKVENFIHIVAELLKSGQLDL